MAQDRKPAKGPGRGGDDGRAEGDGDRRAREAEEIGHQANVNQVQDEPMPASHYDDPRQEAVERNEEYNRGGQERKQPGAGPTSARR